MRTSLATISLPGSLAARLHACAAAGFDAVEIMDSDLAATEESAAEVGEMCRSLGLSITAFQPFRDFEGVDEGVLAENLRRADAAFHLAHQLGAEMVLVCSNVETATIDDDATAARQLGRLADLGAEFGLRIAYEALGWGRYISDYRSAWRLIQIADRPNLGLCLDSFHILAQEQNVGAIEAIDGDRIYLLQLADATMLDLDLLTWSRHHRLFPGEGTFDLEGLLASVQRTGYAGPLSLEIFHDSAEQLDAVETAVHARRSLTRLVDTVQQALGGTASE